MVVVALAALPMDSNMGDTPIPFVVQIGHNMTLIGIYAKKKVGFATAKLSGSIGN